MGGMQGIYFTIQHYFRGDQYSIGLRLQFDRS